MEMVAFRQVQKAVGYRKLPGAENCRDRKTAGSTRSRRLLVGTGLSSREVPAEKEILYYRSLLEDEGEKDAQRPFEENVKNKAEHIRASFLKSLNSA